MKKSRKAGAEADWDADGQEAMSEADYVSGAPAGYSLQAEGGSRLAAYQRAHPHKLHNMVEEKVDEHAHQIADATKVAEKKKVDAKDKKQQLEVTDDEDLQVEDSKLIKY